MTRSETILPTRSAPRPRKRRAGHYAEPLAGPAGRRKSTDSRAVSSDKPDAYSVEEFCRKHRISVQVFYKRPDLMPVSFYVGTRRLISVESAASWRRKREQLAQLADTRNAEGPPSGAGDRPSISHSPQKE